MALLTAILAFAVTMLALATIVTTILELSGRLLQRRLSVFKHMLGQVFEAEIAPLLDRRLRAQLGTGAAGVAAAIAAHRAAFVNGITRSPLKYGQDSSWFSRLCRWIQPNADQSDELTTEEFVRRLARTETGREIYREAAGQIQATVARITLRYEELAAASREYFTHSAGVLSLVIGIGIALVYNIDAYRLVSFFVTNPEAAEAFANRAERTLDEYREAEARLQRTLAAMSAAGGAEGPEAARKAAEDDLKAVQQTLANSRTALSELKQLGLPIGLNQFPHCLISGQPNAVDARCSQTVSGAALIRDGIAWLFWALVTGMLIGLGGPFWYDAVVGLMRVTQMLRGRTPETETSAAGPVAARLMSPTEIFLAHVETRTAVHGYGGPRWRPSPPAGT